MDRRQLLDGLASLTLIGDLADDVILACASARQETEMAPLYAHALERGLTLVRALGEFERPYAATTASLSAMSEAATVSDAIDRLTLSIAGTPSDYFTNLSRDLESIIGGTAETAALERVETFFSTVAVGTVNSAETMLSPRPGELAWTSTASAF